MLKKLGAGAAPKIVDPLLDKIDTNKSGFIEYEEFKKYLFVDPYPIWYQYLLNMSITLLCYFFKILLVFSV